MFPPCVYCSVLTALGINWDCSNRLAMLALLIVPHYSYRSPSTCWPGVLLPALPPGPARLGCVCLSRHCGVRVSRLPAGNGQSNLHLFGSNGAMSPKPDIRVRQCWNLLLCLGMQGHSGATASMFLWTHLFIHLLLQVVKSQEQRQWYILTKTA